MEYTWTQRIIYQCHDVHRKGCKLNVANSIVGVGEYCRCPGRHDVVQIFHGGAGVHDQQQTSVSG